MAGEGAGKPRRKKTLKGLRASTANSADRALLLLCVPPVCFGVVALLDPLLVDPLLLSFSLCVFEVSSQSSFFRSFFVPAFLLAWK
jgi:hypothetical protein